MTTKNAIFRDMQKWLWGAAGACLTAAFGTQSFGVACGFVTAALLFGLAGSAGPLAYALEARTGWRRHMVVIALGVLGGIATWAGASLGYYYYDQEKKERAAEQKRFADLNAELIEQRRRADAAVSLKDRQLAKYNVVNGQIAEAISQGGSIRYALETARNAAIMSGTRAEFDARFDSTEHASAVERWRGATARMLDEQLPAAHVGASFSEVEGRRGDGRSAYALTRVMACIDMLRGLQRDLRSHIEVEIH